MNNPEEIIVVGAGIIGLSIAIELNKRGAGVRVFDRSGIASEASSANAGAFAFTDITPLACPNTVANIPRWLLDHQGPLSVPSSYVLQIIPWLIKFLSASTRAKCMESTKGQGQLMQASRAALQRQIVDVDGEHLIYRDGQLQLYESEKEFRASLADWQLCREYGMDYNLLESREAIAEIQPSLNPRFCYAGFTPDWINTVDPKTWAQHLATTFLNRGGRIEKNNVLSLAHQEGYPLLTTSQGIIKARQAVIAAGAWSHQLAKKLGDNFSLETERGYNTTLPAGSFDLRTHLTFKGHGFVVSRINDGIRIGGGVELGGLKQPPNYKLSEILLQKATDFLLGIKIENGKQWMGFRPSLPDSLPVIDRSPRAQNIFYAFGHGHLGLTQAAATAELISDLLVGITPALPMKAYSSTRF